MSVIATATEVVALVSTLIKLATNDDVSTAVENILNTVINGDEPDARDVRLVMDAIEDLGGTSSDSATDESDVAE